MLDILGGPTQTPGQEVLVRTAGLILAKLVDRRPLVARRFVLAPLLAPLLVPGDADDLLPASLSPPLADPADPDTLVCVEIVRGLRFRRGVTFAFRQVTERAVEVSVERLTQLLAVTDPRCRVPSWEA